MCWPRSFGGELMMCFGRIGMKVYVVLCDGRRWSFSWSVGELEMIEANILLTLWHLRRVTKSRNVRMVSRSSGVFKT